MFGTSVVPNKTTNNITGLYTHGDLALLLHTRDVRDQFLHVETETETQCTQSQFLILRLRLLKLVSNFETETETL